MNLKITLVYFDVLFTNKSLYPWITAHGMIQCNDPHFSCEFKVNKQEFNKNFNLTVTKATMFGKDAEDKVQDRDLALRIKAEIKSQMKDMIVGKL